MTDGLCLLDSDVLIECLKNRQATLARIDRLAIQGMHLACSVISRAELVAGIRADEHQRMQELLTPLASLPVTEDIADSAGELLKHFAKSYGLLEADSMIAATALHHQAVLFTLNRKHFAPLSPPLRLLSWEEPPLQVAEQAPRYGHKRSKIKKRG